MGKQNIIYLKHMPFFLTFPLPTFFLYRGKLTQIKVEDEAMVVAMVEAILILILGKEGKDELFMKPTLPAISVFVTYLYTLGT